MSKGLSRCQKAVLQELKKKGSLTVYDVDDVVWSVKNKGIDKYELFYALRKSIKTTSVKDIKNFTALYRMMDSLVKRGLAGRVLHVRPTLWVDVKDGEPTISAIKSSFKLLERLNEARLVVEIGREIKVFGLPHSEG